jgi:hypothetical protein
MINTTQGSSGFMVITGDWLQGPGTCIEWEVLSLVPLDSTPSSDFPGRWGMVPEVASLGCTPS